MPRFIPLLFALCASLWLFPGLWAEEAADESLTASRPTISIPRLPREPELAEFLDMQPPADLEGKLGMVEGFIQQNPVDGAPSSQMTRVYMGYDDEAIYFVFVAFDDEPEKMRVNLSRREDLFGDEIVEVQLDTFHDQRRAFSFVANPLGVQWDALWTEGQGFDSAWDTVWQSEGEVTDRGYVVRMRIPFKSLRFRPQDQQTWGLVFVRDIPRKNEETFWPRVSNRIEGRLNQEATLEGIGGITPGRNIWLIPYAAARRFRLLSEDDAQPWVRENFEPDAGLDAKFVFKESLTLDLTVNPDFSQVESDQPQVTVNQRFEVFFPERRPFFLENADYFRTPFNLLFTRRIADPRGGARFTGKIGHYNVGALLIDDEAPGKIAPPGSPLDGERAHFGVLRAFRDIGSQSKVGLMFTERELAGSYNRVGGVDGRIKINDHWVNQFQAVYSRTRTLDGALLEDPAFNLIFNRDGRKLNTHIHYQDVGEQFLTRTGFVPRTDIRDLHQDIGYTFWPEGKRLINWGPGLYWQRIEDHDGTALEWNLRTRMRWEFVKQTYFGIFYNSGREHLRLRDFPTLAAPRTYSRGARGFWVETRPIDKVAFNSELFVGEAVNFVPPEGSEPTSADQWFGEVGLTLRPLSRLRISATYLQTRLEDPASGGKIFDNRIGRARFDLQFNLKMTLRLIAEYEETDVDPLLTSLEKTRRVNGDLLLTYLVNPWTAFYVGYNSNFANLDPTLRLPGSGPVRTDGRLTNDARQLFFKFSYLFRP